MKVKNKIGCALSSITRSEGAYGDDRIALNFVDGGSLLFEVSADCCSSSWIEHVEGADDKEGAIFYGMKDGEGVPWDGHVCEDNSDTGENECGHDCLAVYNTVFSTSKGDIVVEYRNDSNGYYGGSLNLVGEDY